MVDSTKGLGSVSNISSANKLRNVSDIGRKDEPTKAERPKDEVKISEEALSLSQAEGTSKEVREALEKNQDVTLGLNPSFDETV